MKIQIVDAGISVYLLNILCVYSVRYVLYTCTHTRARVHAHAGIHVRTHAQQDDCNLLSFILVFTLGIVDRYQA
jgi:hypothetical protein